MFSGGDLLIAAAAFVAGAINAAAGGGSFISFPALLAIGTAPIPANATNNTAMWIGTLASAGTLRRDLDVPKRTLWTLVGVSALGGLIGALLLLHTSNGTFSRLIPYLLLVGTALFILGPAINRAVERSHFRHDLTSPLGIALQGAIAIYGGFFGAAQGILTLALLQALGLTEMRRANALKTLLASCVNGIAVIPFFFAGAILWRPAAIMCAAALAGGYLGARLVQSVPSRILRGFVIVVACTMTAYFFWKNAHG